MTVGVEALVAHLTGVAGDAKMTIHVRTESRIAAELFLTHLAEHGTSTSAVLVVLEHTSGELNIMRYPITDCCYCYTVLQYNIAIYSINSYEVKDKSHQDHTV